MELGIVTQIKTLAQDPANRLAIVRDNGCLPGLVLFLDNQNTHVVDTAVEALSLLSLCAENRPLMWNELGLVLSLNAITGNPLLSEHTRSLARSVHDVIAPKETKDNGEGQKKKSRTVTLQIQGLKDLTCRKMVEEQLLAVKGVVSFTFDMRGGRAGEGRVDIRTLTTTSVETLCDAVAATKIMSAAQVVKTEEGQEVVLSFGKGPGGAAAAEKENRSENRSGPRPLKYLDDDDVMPEVVSAKAVARVGDSGKQGGWLGSIGSYISKSLYW